MSSNNVEYSVVEVNHVTMSYGNTNQGRQILRDLTLVVPCGVIYGLLGPSGCGKTTLLHCVIGRLKPDCGTVAVFGKCPGTQGHCVPGNHVGYMPQELALYSEMTIYETLMYFGRLYGMCKKDIQGRASFLLDLLHLPERSRTIKQLSGGQQRRTSLAVALLHEPPLLILDEPTVGIDPVLRKHIWKHLVAMVQRGTTIVITTHYIEEARQAHLVGFMRNGRLLAEEPPEQIMNRYKLQSLEEVFLHLCEAGDNNEQWSSSGCSDNIEQCHPVNQPPINADESANLLPSYVRQSSGVKFDDSVPFCRKLNWYLPRYQNMVALFIKNVHVLRRRISGLLFEFLLPSLHIIFFCLAIGHDPFDLRMAIVNNETSIGLSNSFLEHLDQHVITQVDYGDNISLAMNAARNGDVWGVIEIGETFTVDLMKRVYLRKPGNATIEGSKIHVHLDMTNKQIATGIQAEVLRAFASFLSSLASTLHLPAGVASVPVQIEEPIYGSLNSSFTDFLAAGIIISIPYFMASGLTALAFVLEQRQGLLDRSFAAGVGTMEVMVGHLACQSVVMSIQVALLMIFALGVFRVPCEGSLGLAVILTLLQGFNGIALGLLISTVAQDETSAVQAALSLVFTNLLLSGIIWSTEAMPTWLRYISYCLPLTLPVESMRSILGRGWDLTHKLVWQGFLVSISYDLLLMVICAVLLRVRKLT